jgi:hypothetical protein
VLLDSCRVRGGFAAAIAVLLAAALTLTLCPRASHLLSAAHLRYEKRTSRKQAEAGGSVTARPARSAWWHSSFPEFKLITFVRTLSAVFPSLNPISSRAPPGYFSKRS